MRRLLVLSILGTTLFLGAGVLQAAATTKPATAPSSNDLLTAQEIRKLVEAKEYRPALQALIRVLDLKGDAAADYDVHEMLMLKAECLLQIRETKSALETLDAAVKIATKDGNEEHLAQATAFSQLIQKSPGNNYVPKTAAIKKPIPILDRELRKSAYEALFNDEFSEFAKLVKAAMATTALQPTLDAAKSAVNMRAVERVSTGSNKKTEELVVQLAQHSIKMINTAEDDLATRGQRIRASATRVVSSQITETDPATGKVYQREIQRRQGLITDDDKVLQQIIDTCTKIPPMMEQMAKWLGTQQDAFHVAALKSSNIKQDAYHTLHDDYRGIIRAD